MGTPKADFFRGIDLQTALSRYLVTNIRVYVVSQDYALKWVKTNHIGKDIFPLLRCSTQVEQKGGKKGQRTTQNDPTGPFPTSTYVCA